MNRIHEAREDLAEALREWRDAGGSVEEVVGAFEFLAREVAHEEAGDNK